MTCEVSLLTLPMRALVAREGQMDVNAEAVCAPVAYCRPVPGLRVATTILCSLMVIGFSVLPGAAVVAEIIEEINPVELRVNFITLDDHYVMTEDGKIFFVIDN